MADANLTEEKTSTEEKIMTESEFLEEQKAALKKNISVWTGVLINLLVVGLVLCLVVYGFLMVAMFVINLLFFLKTKKLLDRIENGEASVKEVYEFYESMGRRSIKLFAVNIFCGGGFGVIGTINDMKVSEAGMSDGLKILGEGYKDDRIANDPKAQWRYCIYCKRNKTEAFYIYKLTDGVICDGCLELDEANHLFRIAQPGEFDSARAGGGSGLVHPYSAIKGIAYEMIYEYDTPSDSNNGGWRYINLNSIVLPIDNPYLKEETFTLKKIPTDFFANSKKPQIEYAEQTVNELQEIFQKPVLEHRKLHR